MFIVKWTKTLAILLLLRRSTAAAVVHETGNTISLSCENLIDKQKNCDSTTWLFKSSKKTNLVELVAFGQIVSKKVELSKARRLHVLENCSLEIKDITTEDVGVYHCRQNVLGRKQRPESRVELALISMSEMVFKDTGTLNCTVTTYERCKVKVQLMFRGNNDEKSRSHGSSEYSCNTSRTFPVYQREFKDRLTSLWCIVEDNNSRHEFPFRPRPSERNTGTTTQSTTVPNILSSDLKDWWWVFVIVTVLLAAACTLTCVTVLWCQRNKGRKTHATENANQEDGVLYTSIISTRIRKAKIRDKNDESQCETVTYSTVRAPSTDPSHIKVSPNPSN